MKKQIAGIWVLGLVLGFGGSVQAKKIIVDKSSISPTAPYPHDQITFDNSLSNAYYKINVRLDD